VTIRGVVQSSQLAVEYIPVIALLFDANYPLTIKNSSLIFQNLEINLLFNEKIRGESVRTR